MVSEQLQSLEKEKRLRPDNDPADDSDDNLDSGSKSSSMSEEHLGLLAP
jgi:hypothetical protein